MKLKDFEQLKKIMDRAQSENDHEALASLRAANKILERSGGLTWTRVLSRTVNVINEAETDPEDAPDANELGTNRPRTRTVDERKMQKIADESLLAEAGRAAQYQSQYARDAVDDITEALALKGFITKGQREYMQDIAAGGRRRRK